MIKAIMLVLILAAIAACSAPERTNFNYCNADADCVHYWTGYDSKLCAVCDMADERWVCANSHEKTVRMADLLDKEAYPQDCKICKLEVKGHECKCVRGVCVKK